ncbi:conserved protein of unknown function (plasmid) [Rhodovastum atsumiense]|uniref:Uncharacterized protein n=1 Tax=Rhodovastum atsumiense TaxID=504468 RepID=A0A5M6IU19_9PROT|nr:hypothetical protein [Rhodovastum atsumiense]KAA5611810.1 hypothetical protein F1189_12275 [Rhodovastum atsumiense]CAH2606082.1 conserved protein of unknown function [Rhodovastum atsumiense]
MTTTIIPQLLSTTVMDASGLFGIERTGTDMLRAVGPHGHISEWAVTDAVAEQLVLCGMPDGDEIAAMLEDGECDEAANEAWQFVNAWDHMAEGTVLTHIAAILSNVGAKVRLRCGLAWVQPSPDGLIYLATAFEERSSVGVRPEAAASIMSWWEGVDAAADLASEYAEDPADIARALLRRWDINAAAMAAAAERTAA